MGKKIKIYESEIKRATRRKLMERIVDEEYEMKDSYSSAKFKPTPGETRLEKVFGQYGEDMDPAVIRYMRKNPDHILRRLAKMYPEIYMRNAPIQPEYRDDVDGDDIPGFEGTMDSLDDISIMDEAEETTVKQTKYSKDEVSRAEQKGVGIDVNGSLNFGKDGSMTVTSKNESTKRLIKRFLNK
jgi:hypothetical protein